MQKINSKILVPTDFSKVAESAVFHAAKIAKKGNDAVCLLHVINSETKSRLRKKNEALASLENKLNEMSKVYEKKLNIGFYYQLKEGSIFTTISEVANEIRANLIVMGTHGVIGMQKITGAYAIKVVQSSKIPVIIVQEKFPHATSVFKIVSPIDESIETKQKTLQTISIAKTLDANVFLFKKFSADDYTNDLINLNINFVTRYLSEHRINFEVTNHDKSNKNFAKDFLEYSKSIDANLIIILTTAEKGLKDFFIGTEEQMVINNKEQIPVMCVNPLQNLYGTKMQP